MATTKEIEERREGHVDRVRKSKAPNFSWSYYFPTENIGDF